MNKKNNKGFSLIELIVVVAIMAVLVGVLAPTYLRYVEKTRLQKDVSAVGEFVQAIKVAAADEDVYDDIKDNETVKYTINGSSIAYGNDKLSEELKTTIKDIKLTSSSVTSVEVEVSDDGGTLKIVVNATGEKASEFNNLGTAAGTVKPSGDGSTTQG